MTKSSSCVRSSHPPTPALAAPHPPPLPPPTQSPWKTRIRSRLLAGLQGCRACESQAWLCGSCCSKPGPGDSPSLDVQFLRSTGLLDVAQVCALWLKGQCSSDEHVFRDQPACLWINPWSPPSSSGGCPSTHFTDQESKAGAHQLQARTLFWGFFTGVRALNPCHALHPKLTEHNRESTSDVALCFSVAMATETCVGVALPPPRLYRGTHCLPSLGLQTEGSTSQSLSFSGLSSFCREKRVPVPLSSPAPLGHSAGGRGSSGRSAPQAAVRCLRGPEPPAQDFIHVVAVGSATALSASCSLPPFYRPGN